MKMTPIERFDNDPLFHTIVETMVGMMESGQCDGATLQHAAVFASIRHGMIHGMSPCMEAINFIKGTMDRKGEQDDDSQG